MQEKGNIVTNLPMRESTVYKKSTVHDKYCIFIACIIKRILRDSPTKKFVRLSLSMIH
jgi:hypothetical protein